MARLNVPRQPIRTHEGAKAAHINPEQQLRRSVMACMLWEGNFYEDGQSVADRITETVKLVKPETVADIARQARSSMKLRHVPLLIAKTMCSLDTHKHLVADLLGDIIQRPDELAEFLAIYWKDGRTPVSSQVKKGLAKAFQKFNAFSLAKWNKDGAIKLRDVLFLCHAKPKDDDQANIWKQLINGQLPTPDTWEVSLSAGGDKKESWERLLSENKLGALALLRNLRNMQQAGVDNSVIINGLRNINVERVLPFRFITAARYSPHLEPYLEEAMFKCIQGKGKIPGKTILMVDVSGSMDWAMSAKSDMTRMDAACGLAVLAREICEEVEVWTFSEKLVAIPLRRGFALRDAIVKSQGHGGTYLGGAIRSLISKHDRMIVFTDEQIHDSVPSPQEKGYMVNVATNQNGVGYGAWHHVDGFSEAILDYIAAVEN